MFRTPSIIGTTFLCNRDSIEWRIVIPSIKFKSGHSFPQLSIPSHSTLSLHNQSTYSIFSLHFSFYFLSFYYLTLLSLSFSSHYFLSPMSLSTFSLFSLATFSPTFSLYFLTTISHPFSSAIPLSPISFTHTKCDSSFMSWHELLCC